MKVRRAKKGEMFRCGVGHHWPEALLVEGQDPPNLNGTYCLVCFGLRVVGRLAVPRTDAVADPFEPVQAEPEQEESHASEASVGADPDSGEAEGEAGETGDPTGPPLGEPTGDEPTG